VTALLAFVDGNPVGWCNYGETTRLAGLVHRFGLQAPDHEGVGSVACFVIAAPIAATASPHGCSMPLSSDCASAG
jgi:hypothetical protein